MLKFRISSLVRALMLILFASVALEMAATDSFARAGGGRRSMGRSAPSRQYSSPAPQNRPGQAPPPNYAQPQPRGGGFMRGLAGGVAGGFLGSMLFSSMGHAAGGMGGGVGGGGIGLIEIILIAGLAYLAFRWWKSRQMKLGTAAGANGHGTSAFSTPYGAQGYSSPESNYAPAQPMANSYIDSGTSIQADEASDLFFKVQGAWTRRDLSSVNEILGPEIYQELARDVADLKAKRQINRLENISVRKVDVLDRWNDQGSEYAKIRFTANLLDYTVDEQSGATVEGSTTTPVKFEEDWTFCRQTAYAAWQLVGIEQT